VTLDRRRAQAYIRDQADRSFQDLHESGEKVKCHGKPALYVDFKPNDRPSPEGAQRLCAGCPVLQECRDIAHNSPRGILHGVYGGQTWIDGVIQTD